MPRLTTQALALSEAYRTSGARRRIHGRYKAYSVSTERKYHTSRTTGLRFFEYGDAVLHANGRMPLAEAVRIAEHIAACGFHAVVLPHGGEGEARLMATTAHRDSGRVALYDEDLTWETMKLYAVDWDQEKSKACWAHANKVSGY